MQINPKEHVDSTEEDHNVTYYTVDPAGERAGQQLKEFEGMKLKPTKE